MQLSVMLPSHAESLVVVVESWGHFELPSVDTVLQENRGCDLGEEECL